MQLPGPFVHAPFTHAPQSHSASLVQWMTTQPCPPTPGMQRVFLGQE
jgi:hypothetical protein